MNDSFGVHILNSLDDLSHDNWRGLFLKRSLFFKYVEESSFCSKFHEEVYSILVTEEVIELN